MHEFSEKTDKELIMLLQQNSLIAFKEIYRRYWKKLFGDAYKRLKSKELSEELVQELFTKLWLKRQALLIGTELGAYLFSSVRYLIIDQYRKDLVRQRHAESLKIVNADVDNSTEEEILVNDLKNIISQQVDQLPPKCREVYVLSRVEYKSNKEIAKRLGISEKTVENHLIKALKRLRIGIYRYYLLILALLLKNIL